MVRANDPPDGGSVPPGYTNDTSQSGTLTSYLQSHRLPLVGGQVLADSSGNQQVILYGFVASDFGRQDAADKARRYLHNPNVPVINRIAVRPELASGASGSAPAPAASQSGASGGAYGSSGDAGASGSSGNELGSVQSYQDQAQQAQQQQQYMQQAQPGGGASGLTAIVPLIGMMGMLGMGSGSSFGMGGGGYPPTYGSPYGGGSPFGSPFGSALWWFALQPLWRRAVWLLRRQPYGRRLMRRRTAIPANLSLIEPAQDCLSSARGRTRGCRRRAAPALPSRRNGRPTASPSSARTL